MPNPTLRSPGLAASEQLCHPLEAEISGVTRSALSFVVGCIGRSPSLEEEFHHVHAPIANGLNERGITVVI